jgi:hypothetical protein
MNMKAFLVTVGQHTWRIGAGKHFSITVQQLIRGHVQKGFVLACEAVETVFSPCAASYGKEQGFPGAFLPQNIDGSLDLPRYFQRKTSGQKLILDIRSGNGET